MGRDIIHAGAAAFPIQIERLRNPKLQSYPILLAPPNDRAVIFAVSDEARQAGIRAGMLVNAALKLCRDAVVLPPNEPLYFRAAAEMNRILGELTPVLEPVRQGQTFLDVTGSHRLFGGAVNIGHKALKEIQSRLHLNLRVGVASNKLVSRIATCASSPNELEFVRQGEEAHFIAPFHVYLLPQVTQKVHEQLLALNINRIHELALVSLSHLTLVFGKLGIQLHNYAQGIDPRPVLPPTHSPGIMELKILDDDTNDIELLQANLFVMLEQVVGQLRKTRTIAQKLRLFVRYSDYREDKADTRLPEVPDYEIQLFTIGHDLLERTLRRRVRVRQLAIKLWGLKPKSTQLTLFASNQPSKTEIAMRAMEKIRTRWGYDAIRFARG
ncbi:hypothetical protein JXJ21_25995 [candidate division KSB1 bacterium]|nr:hypothetical protein [candidate division KSB1 bacterium]